MASPSADNPIQIRDTRKRDELKLHRHRAFVGALAGPSFDVLVGQELDAAKERGRKLEDLGRNASLLPLRKIASCGSRNRTGVDGFGANPVRDR